MKHTKPLLTIALVLSTSLAFAQPPGNNDGAGQNKPPQNNQNSNDPSEKPPRDGKNRPKPPLLEALDTNGDGIISAEEIANAPESLKKLDKNGDGKITPDELRPPRPKDGPPPGGNDNNSNGGQKKQRPPSEQQQGQGNNPPADGQKVGRGQGGPGKDGAPGADDQKGRRQPPPPSPLMTALDTDKDGSLSADEIANASESLKKLDKNGDGQLTPEEYRPAPRDREKGPQDANKGPRNADGNPPPAPQDNNAANPKKRPQAE